MEILSQNFSKHLTVSKNQKPRKGYDLKDATVYTKAGKILSDLSSYNCTGCKLVLRNPHQLLECGCRYCEPCVEDLFVNMNPVCVEDNEPVSKDEVRLDKASLREIKSLKIECPGAERSCIWNGGISEYEEHFDECNFVFITCDCGQKILRSEIRNHAVKCPLNIEEDMLSFDSKSSGFDSKSSGFDSMIVCQYPGCSFSGDMDTVNSHSLEHIHSLSMILISMEGNMKHLQADYKKMEQIEETLEKRIHSCDKQLASLQQQVAVIPTLEKQITELQQQITKVGMIESDSAHSGRHGVSLESMSGSYGSSDELSSLNERVSQLEQEVIYLKPYVRDAKAEITTQRGQLAGYIDTVQTMQESVTRHSVTMDEIKLRQDILDVKTVHGIFIWKIPDIQRRFRDAQDKRTLSLYSPPFHTSPHGYRACIRCYLNGDGGGLESHVSVFFVLMKSEHDNLLKWPFERPVTFELVNQETRSQSITETFMPNKRSSSFQKPKTEMNLASGFPRFASHEVLSQHQFTKGDAMYIRCKIDTSGLNFD